MTGSLTDGAQALFLWKNMGMTKCPKRARHPAQLARLTIDVATDYFCSVTLGS
jgi:hypothetical protein